jgi:hypothetical protein
VKRSGDLGVYVQRRNGDLPIWGSARPASAVCGLRPGTCDAKRRTGVWRRPKGIRVSALVEKAELTREGRTELTVF